MLIIDTITVALILLGGAFFLVGTIGLLRFPDIYTRLHALTKADNVGLGLIIGGLILQSDSWTVSLKLLFIWCLVLLAGASIAHLIAVVARQRGVKLWKP